MVAGLKERLLCRINCLDNGCWIFIGCYDELGYGRITHKGRAIKAHRASWIVHLGLIPDGMHVLHKCDVRPCVNPDHLFLGTHEDNMRDMAAKGRQPPRYGTNNGRAMLVEEDVKVIRKLLAEGVKQSDIARKYMVATTTISQINIGNTWRHVL